jgi:LysM repeat protein
MAFHSKKFELSPRLKLGVGRGYSQNQVLKFTAVLCLILAVGLAFNAVRLLIGGKGQANSGSSAPQVLGASDNKLQDSQQSIEFTTYTVQKGDTLFSISQKYNISWTTMATLNNLKSQFYLKAGQELKVPKQ